ncbi:MAG: translocation/assembly module TamB [Prolixibacteraceae bacterium]|nr:translocation/assembly module TamB [Prolixibacteraceae bacterium]
MAAIILLITAFYVLSQSSRVQRFLTQKIANSFAGQLNTEFHIGGVDISLFNNLVLKEVWLEDKNKDTLLYVQKLVAAIDSFSVKRKFIALGSIDFNNAKLFLSVDSTGEYNYILPETIKSDKNTGNQNWDITCSDFGFKESGFFFGPGVFNFNKGQEFTNINLNLTGLKLIADTISANIRSLSFQNSGNIGIQNLSANLRLAPNNILAEKINLKTEKSFLENTSLEIIKNDSIPDFINGDINLIVGQSNFSFEDISKLIPAVQGMDERVELSGKIYGNLTDLKGRDIVIKTGDYTYISCNFYVNDLPDFNNAYLFFDLSFLQTTFNDLSNLKLPVSAKTRMLTFPESFYDAGILTYKGNFTGFFQDFVAYGKLESKMGSISTDLSFKPVEDGSLELNGKLTSNEFEVGLLFNKDILGKISFNGAINGVYEKDSNKIMGTFNGGISNFGINGYNYKNITLNGLFDSKNFDGFITVDDPNLKLDFLGKLYFNPEIPEFDFDLSVRKANLVAIKLDSIHQISDLAFISKANFKGNNIDNLSGFINIENGSYMNSNGELTLKDFGIRTEPKGPDKELSLNSEFADVTVLGQYNLKTLPLTFKYILSKYLPALSDDSDKLLETYHNKFSYDVDIKDLDRLTNVFKPSLTINTPFKIEGEIDSENNFFTLTGNIPGISMENILIKNILLRAETDSLYSSNIKIAEIETRSGINIYNLAFNAEAKDNKLDTRLIWNNYHENTYSGEINTTTELFNSGKNLAARIEINPSKIYFADSLWLVMPGHLDIDSTSIKIKVLEFKGQDQSIQASGAISEDPKDRLTVSFQDINLKMIEKYMLNEPTLSGIVNGDIGIENFYKQRLIFTDLNLNNFWYRDHEFGNITLSSFWDSEKDLINANLKLIRGDELKLSANGFFNPASKELEFNAYVNKLRTIILEKVIKNSLSDFRGTASGHLKIHGNPDNILLDGSLWGEEAGLKIDYTQVNYTFSDSVRFKGNKIIFDHIKITDDLNNSGIFNGTISHTNFEDMVYDLSISSPRILALNTNMGNNSQFFGKVIADGNFYVTGKGVNINLDGDGKTLRGTDVSISLDSEQEAEQYDFIRFVNPDIKQEDEEIGFINRPDTSLNLNLRVEVTPEARAQLIYNSQVGDIIRGQGEGVLQFGMDRNGDITIYGNYNIVEGDYLFTLKSVINKRFTIENGGYINWSGDPYNAKINIDATYNLKASLYELFANSNFDVDKSQRIPVECKILLSGNLTNPDINFDVKFPMVETRLVDELQQFFNTEEEMNRQIISLVVLGQFYTPEYMRGTYEAVTSSSYAIGSTASELFSNQVSNWLSQLNDDFDIGFNYRPGTQLTRDEIELALSKQMFNDRVTINGNIGNNVNPTSTNNSQIVGDFDLKVKLTDNGKIQLKAFNRSNNNLIYETAPYTQGIGLTFKEEYNTMEELLDKLLSVVKRKN